MSATLSRPWWRPASSARSTAADVASPAQLLTRSSLPAPLERALLLPTPAWIASQLDPLWARRESRALVTHVRDEADGCRTLTLHPDQRWTGFRAGQAIPLHVDRGGRRTTRLVWASSAPCADGTVSVTVHRLHDDPAGDWLLDRAQEGDVLPIGAAVGDFALPNEAPARLLFVAQGAGLIPVFSLLLSLAYSEQLRDAALVVRVRTPDSLLFAERLRALGHAFRGLTLHVLLEGTEGDDDAASLLQAIEARVPDAAQRCTWVAGSEQLLTAVAEQRRRAHATGTLRVAHVVP